MADTDLILDVIERRRGNALRDGAADLDHLADSADGTNSSMRSLGRDTSFVDSEIVRLRGHIGDLTRELDRTGNTTLLKNIRTDKSALRQFESLAKTLGEAGAVGGREFNKGFLSTMGELGGNLRGAVIPVAIGMAALFAPIIGAAVGGAVVGAVGLGGIAGGIFAAAQDPQVKAAARHFGEDIVHEFTGSGKSFVQPIIEGLDVLEQGFRDMELGEFFEKLAPQVTKVAEGISGMFTSMMPGLNAMADNLGPFMDVLADELPEVGAAFGDMVAEISASEGAVEGLQFVFEFLEATLRVTGTTVTWLSDRFHDMAVFSENATAIVSGLIRLTPGLDGLAAPFDNMNRQLNEILGTAPKMESMWAPIPGRFNAAASSASGFTSSVSTMTMSIKDLTSALDRLFDVQMSQDQALLAIQRDTLELTNVVKAHGASIDANTEAGVINRSLILQLIQDYEKQRQAAIKAGDGTAVATRKFNDQIDALGELMSDLGFTKKQVDTLLGAYRRLHDAPDIQKEIRINVALTGQTGALSRIGNVGAIPTFDTGGWVDGPRGAPQLAVVHGGEFVVSNEMQKRGVTMPRTSPSRSEPRVIQPVVVPTGHQAFDDFIGEIVRRFVYFRGGDPQTALAS